MFGFEGFVQQDAANNQDKTLAYCICCQPPFSALHCCHKYGQRNERGNFHITNTSCRYNIYEHHNMLCMSHEHVHLCLPSRLILSLQNCIYSVKIKYMHVSRVLFQTFLLLHLSSVSPNSGTLAKLKDVLSVGV